MFVDRVQVKLQAGDGGDGAVSFRHEKIRPKGGPDGGDGGKGGSIILKASRNQNTLAAFRYQRLLKAEDGQAGSKSNRHGRNGLDLEVAVPVGTLVSDMSGEAMADLTSDGQEVVIARGGIGGFGNAHFVSSTRRAPRVSEKGEDGQAMDSVFELKMIADVGIVGLPNAGKSTLLSVISNAKPEIANYPFTTLQPNLGVVDIDKTHSLLFADIPGLIEGASEGKGLGDEFLRHVERTAVLIHLIDAYSEDVARDYKTIMAELKAYYTDLSKRPQIVALTKIEGLDKKVLDKKLSLLIKNVTKGTPVLAISSANKEGVPKLLRLTQKLVEKNKKQLADKTADLVPVIGLRENDDSWRVEAPGDNRFIVIGRKIEGFAGRTKSGDHFGEQRLMDILRKMGIMRDLERRGIKPGQIIQIGEPAIAELNY